MRAYIKKQCLDTIDILLEAHEELDNLITSGNIAEAIDVLTQCQEGAITVGSTIESAEGEGTSEVGLLEKYCEMVYQLGEEISAGTIGNLRGRLKDIDKPLLHAASAVKNNISTEREVLFMPYKASMWDSLETIYEELKSDDTVSVYVMPIPYYDKNPDGSFRLMHYEADDFPEEMNVISYLGYDIMSRHPEAIYIHNPYDEGNYITSVHPDYYSSKLCEYTDELIYVPYFVLGDVDPDNQEALEAVKHLIITNVMKYASRVIIWSEEWRAAYINVLSDYFGEDTRKYWENLIIVRSSSKLDRVRSLKEADYEMPADWESKSTKADGSRKKIIFYNTSVDALLKGSDDMIDKIERVLKTFEELREDVTLLWRPHPLIEATLTSMRPALWIKYKEIVDRYILEDWGIYDDSAKLERAIAISDAYYGDWSSVVIMYKETGKPIMIQNCEV